MGVELAESSSSEEQRKKTEIQLACFIIIVLAIFNGMVYTLYHLHGLEGGVPPLARGEIDEVTDDVTNRTGAKIVNPGPFRYWLEGKDVIFSSQEFYPAQNYAVALLLPGLVLLALLPIQFDTHVAVRCVSTCISILAIMTGMLYIVPVVLTLLGPYVFMVFITIGIYIWLRHDPVEGIKYDADKDIVIKQVEVANSLLIASISQSVWGVIAITLAGLAGIVAFTFQTGFFNSSEEFSRLQIATLLVFIGCMVAGVLYFITLRAYRTSIEIRKRLGQYKEPEAKKNQGAGGPGEKPQS